MSLFNRLFGKKPAAPAPLDPAVLMQAFQQFVMAGTWTESQRIVEQQPILLHPQADDLLQQLAAAQDDAAVRDLVEEHRQLLHRCREVGIARAFQEKMASSSTQSSPAEQDAAGTEPGMPPEVERVLRDILAELAASGVEIRSPADLEQALAARPDLQAQLAAALPVTGAGSGPEVPAEFRSDLQQAQEGQVYYRRTGDVRGLDAAVAAWERILGHRGFSMTDARFQLAAMNDAAGAFWRLYSARGRIADLDRVLELMQSAVQRTRADSPDLPGYLNNLGNGLRARYARTGRLADLEEAIRVSETAVQRTPADSPDLPSRLNNLGTGLRDRYARTGRLADLEEAIADWQRACQRGLEVTLEKALRSADNWANTSFTYQRWSDVVDAYAVVRIAIANLLQTQVDRAAKESWLQAAQGLPGLAAYALARLARLPEAVEALEQGRARLLAEALEQSRRDLQRLPALGFQAHYERYKQAAAAVEQFQQQIAQPAQPLPGQPTVRPDYATLRQQLEAARVELAAAIEAIRQVRIDGQQPYADFLLPSTFAKIQPAATPQAPLVYLLATPAGGLALVVGAPSPRGEVSGTSPRDAPVAAIWLDELTEAALRAHLYGPADDPTLGGYLGGYAGWREAMGRYAAVQRQAQTLAGQPAALAALQPALAAVMAARETAQQAWHAALDDTTRWLWQAVMEPLLAQLAPDSHLDSGIRLIASGLLSLLPLHAAWTADAAAPSGRRYALDLLSINYAPNAQSLVAAQTTAAQVAADGMLAIDNPDGSLVFSRQEVEAVLAYFPAARRQVLRGVAATHAAVSRELGRYPVLHFSTHGWAGWQEPLTSGLLLAGDPPLTLGDILDQRVTGARLAVLSACETGIPGTKVLEEVVSLPTGLAQAGVPGVVASLWAVNDLSTAMLMERFYRFWREDGLAPGAALRAAQRWLRDTTNREKAAYFKRDLPALAAFRMPELVAADLYVDRMLQDDPDARPFVHPFYWAAFSMTGV